MAAKSSKAVEPSSAVEISSLPDVADPSLYIHPELSRLSFNDRVLAQASDPTVPLLERLRFLTIASTNLDEFFEVRAAGLQHQAAHEAVRLGPDGLTPLEALRRISAAAHYMVSEQYRTLNEQLLPALAEVGIHILRRSEWSDEHAAWLARYFEDQVIPVLTPTGLDPAHPFPNVRNKSLNFILTLKGKDAFGRQMGLAVVQAPRCLPRLIALPSTKSRRRHEFVLLSSVIHAHVDALFPGMKVTGCHQFRVTRNSDLWVDEEVVDDLLHALSGELTTRAYGDAVRLEVADTCDDAICRYLLDVFDLSQQDLYRVNGPVNLYRLAELYAMVDRPRLKWEPFSPGLPMPVSHGGDFFQTLRSRDILLHHPYESFSPVLELLNQAARDPRVLAIKQTLYRTGAESPVVEALHEAARRGKEVTAVVELRARFDEAANIDLATRLQQAGAHVVYGVVGYKAHAKILLIVRREEDGTLRRYCHTGTGNYHAGTARAYTDISLLTADEGIGRDVHNVFQQLTGVGKDVPLHYLLHSPFTLQPTLLTLIDAEAEAARAGQPAKIMARVNNLSDPAIIQALYRASAAGVPIDLIVRTICCLRPGVPGVSDTITVCSVVGRFLEHSRVFYFHAGGEQKVYGASADWMPRNLYRRVEVAFPILNKRLKKRVIREAFELPLLDNCEAWDLAESGGYTRRQPAEGATALSSQRRLLQLLSAEV